MAKRKQAKVDFDTAKLPATRWQLLGDIYKNRIPLLADMGLLLLLFWLPLAAVNMLMLAQSADISHSLSQGRITAVQAAQQMIQIRNAGNILLIPTLAVLAVGVAGILQVVKNLVWQEGVLFKGDFRHGVKSNWRCCCLTAVIAGILNYAANYLIHIGYFEDGSALEWGIVAVLAAAAIFAMAMPFLLIQSTVYALPYVHKLSNSLLLSMRTFLPSLGIMVLNILPFLVLLIDDYTVFIFALLLIPVVALPTLVLVDTLYVHSVLDRYINQVHFPEIYRKGLYVDAQHPTGGSV